MSDDNNAGLLRKVTGAKTIFRVILAVIGLLVLLISIPIIKMARSELKSKQQQMASQVEPDIGIIVITTKYPGIPINLDPGQRITAAPTMSNIEWEQAINGVPAQRNPVVGDPISLSMADPSIIRKPLTAAYRIVEGQGIENAEIAYVKHYDKQPPKGWYEAALKSRRH